MENKNSKEIIDSPEKRELETNVDFKEMILWWEKRRLIYNALIIGLSTYLIYDFWDYPMRAMKGGAEIIINSIIFIFGANLFYTLGWGIGVIGIRFFKSKGLTNTGRWIVFIIGTIFSLVWTNFHFVMEFDVLFV